MKQRLVALILAVLFCVSTAACGASSAAGTATAYDRAGSSNESANYSSSRQQAAAAPEAPSAKDASYGGGATGVTAGDASYTTIKAPSDGSTFSPGDDRKLIKQASLELQTKEFDQSLVNIDALINATASYIESRSVSGYNPDNSYSQRTASIVVRVPAERLEEFLAAKDTLGNVLSSNVWQEDVTMTYVDTEARLDSLKLKRERLLEILKQATELKYILELENELSNTVYQIESYQSSLTKLDNQISYSTVSISLREVARETTVTEVPKTLGDRIAQQFTRTVEATRIFFEDLLVSIVGASPVLLFLLIVLVVLLISLRAGAKKRARRLEQERLARIEEEKRRLANLPKPEDNKQEPPKQ